jgi:hypothetical protein
MKLKTLITLSIFIILYSSCCLDKECTNFQPYEFHIIFKSNKTNQTIQATKVKIKIDSIKSIGSFRISNISSKVDTLYAINFFYSGLDASHKTTLTINDTLKIPITLELRQIPRSECCPATIDGLDQVVVTKPNTSTSILPEFTLWNTIVLKNLKLVTVKL